MKTQRIIFSIERRPLLEKALEEASRLLIGNPADIISIEDTSEPDLISVNIKLKDAAMLWAFVTMYERIRVEHDLTLN